MKNVACPDKTMSCPYYKAFCFMSKKVDSRWAGTFE